MYKWVVPRVSRGDGRCQRQEGVSMLVFDPIFSLFNEIAGALGSSDVET